MCKGPVARGNMMLGLQHDQNLGCQEWVRRNEAKGLPGPGPESSKASVVQTAGLSVSVGHEMNLVGHSQHWGNVKKKKKE